MKVDLCASHSHYREHLLPIWQALPPEVQGEMFLQPTRANRADLTLVAGRVDIDAMAPRKVVQVEHGVGQTWIETYTSRHQPGGHQPSHVVGYIGPGYQAVDKWRDANPRRPAIAVGCPRMDRLHRERPAPEPRTVALGWRWDAPIGRTCPEQRPALPHYVEYLPQIIAIWRAQGWTVLGHGHPRARRELTALYRNLGVRPIWDADELLSRASMLVMDNSSFLYEAASLERTVIALDAPWYRRDVEHGMRFWSHVPGRRASGPGDLADIDLDYARGDLDGAIMRKRAVEHAYVATDGHAAERAASFVLDLLAL